MTLPVLYSFRRCPYAMRARLALMHCGAQYLLREVVLKDKPAHMLEVSDKGTVPVLILPIDDYGATGSIAHRSGSSSSTTNKYRVIDESISIMHWAMNENPSRHLQNAKQWLITESLSVHEINTLIEQNDFEFKGHLDKYKYSDRHPEHSQDYYFEQAKPFLENIENKLSHYPYLGGSRFRFPDAVVLPFIRQFSMVKPKQFNALALPKLQQWLTTGLESDLFKSVMHKVPQWKEESGDGLIVLGDN